MGFVASWLCNRGFVALWRLAVRIKGHLSWQDIGIRFEAEDLKKRHVQKDALVQIQWLPPRE